MDPFLSAKFSAPFAAHLPIGPAAKVLWGPWAQPRFGAVTNGPRSFPTAPSESVSPQIRLARFWPPGRQSSDFAAGGSSERSPGCVGLAKYFE